ncbi:MAG: hypothetical protein ACREDR_24570 [Blastocatellia bacterium]
MSAKMEPAAWNTGTLNETRLEQDIDRMPELRGAGIVYIDDRTCRLVRPSAHSSGLQTLIIIEDRTVEVPQQQGPASASVPDHHGHSISSELVSLGLNCGGTALAGTGLVAEGGGAVFTDGLSLIPITLTYAAFVASAAQCVNSAGRVIALAVDSESLDGLDSNRWYTATSQVLDAISLADVPNAFGEGIKTIMVLRRSSGRPFVDLLKGMSRPERKRLAKELATMTGDAASGKEFKALVRAGKLPAIFSQTAINEGIRLRLMDAVGGSLGLVGSARDGVIHGIGESLIRESGSVGSPGTPSAPPLTPRTSRVVNVYVKQE